MIIKVLSKRQIEVYELEVDHSVISIVDHDSSVILPENRKCKGVLSLKFDDISHQENIDEMREIGDNRPFVMFDKDMAAKILDFYWECRKNNIEYLLIHCHAGISRSAGVASFLEKLRNYGSSGEDYGNHGIVINKFDTSLYYHPNPLVRSILREVYKERTGKYLY